MGYEFVKDVFPILQICLTASEKLVIDFPEKPIPAIVKYLLPVTELRNFSEGNVRKFTVSIAFCAHVEVIKYKKNTDVFL